MKKGINSEHGGISVLIKDCDTRQQGGVRLGEVAVVIAGQLSVCCVCMCCYFPQTFECTRLKVAKPVTY